LLRAQRFATRDFSPARASRALQTPRLRSCAPRDSPRVIFSPARAPRALQTPRLRSCAPSDSPRVIYSPARAPRALQTPARAARALAGLVGAPRWTWSGPVRFAYLRSLRYSFAALSLRYRCAALSLRRQPEIESQLDLPGGPARTSCRGRVPGPSAHRSRAGTLV
jgi:hypothetical protein